MYEFNYHKASSVADAAGMLAKNPDAKLLAGGQTLIASMKLRLASPPYLVDLRDIAELRGIKIDGGTLTHRCDDAARGSGGIEGSAAVDPRAGQARRRDRGPHGAQHGDARGSVVNNDPAADYPAAVLGLGATVNTDKRKIPADQFFTGMFETALQPGEIVTSVVFPIPKRAAYMKFKNPASRYAIVGVFVADTGGGVRVAVTGAGPSVFRIGEMERALSSKFAPDAVAGIKVPPGGLNSDMHASAEYRAHLITVMAKRAVDQALSAVKVPLPPWRERVG